MGWREAKTSRSDDVDDAVEAHAMIIQRIRGAKVFISYIVYKLVFLSSSLLFFSFVSNEDLCGRNVLQ